MDFRRFIHRVFVHALNTVKKIPRTGSARPPSAERLKLYGLYKQSMEGDVAGVMARPEEEGERGTGEVEKWDAWSAQHGLSRTAAKRRYISTLIATMHTYASSTAEARALVAELEFVWDQIRANEASASDHSRSSRPRADGPRVDRSPHRPGMRLLRPISSGDDASLAAEDKDAEEDDGAFEDADDGGLVASDRRPSGGETDYDVRKRKWRARMERAVVRLGAEVAALREGVEARRGWGEVLGGGRRKRGWWAFVTWLLWAVMRHVLIDVVVGLGAVAWVRRGRVRDVLGAWVREARRRVREKG
ncbi:hypothetical protein MMC11_002332 [Xylographa trunciseda]|nr:hypothetical protein [Xylographa trunciseda]